MNASRSTQVELNRRSSHYRANSLDFVLPPTLLPHYLAAVRQMSGEINKAIAELESPILSEAASYTLNSGGKRLRPMLAFLGAKASRASTGGPIEVMVAGELFHSAGLIQDDIIDKHNIRRAQSTLHKKFGLPIALVVSDLLFCKAFEALLNSRNNLGDKKSLSVTNLFCRAFMDACVGESLDLRLNSKFYPKQYVRVAALKTAALTEACIAGGAIAGGANGQTLRALRNFGQNFGIAFQLADDLADFASSRRMKTRVRGSTKLSPWRPNNAEDSAGFSAPRTMKLLSEYLDACKSCLAVLVPTDATRALIGLVDAVASATTENRFLNGKTYVAKGLMNSRAKALASQAPSLGPGLARSDRTNRN